MTENARMANKPGNEGKTPSAYSSSGRRRRTSRSESEPENAATARRGDCLDTTSSPTSERIAITLLRPASPSSSFRGHENARSSFETITMAKRASRSRWSICGRGR